MKWITLFSLSVAAIVHTLPVLGAFGAPWLQKLYGLEFAEPNVLLLMRHRAVLFGILACVMVYAMWVPTFRWFALGMALVSTLSFVLMASPSSSHTPEIAKVVRIDWAVIVLLVVACVGEVISAWRADEV